MRTLLGLPSVGQGLCGGTSPEEQAWGEQGGHQGTQARNAGQVGLNMALAVMQKTPTLLMNCEAGSGTRYVCLHYRGVAEALGYPLLDRASNTQTLHFVCRLGLPKGMEVSRVDNGSLEIGWTGVGPYQDQLRNEQEWFWS